MKSKNTWIAGAMLAVLLPLPLEGASLPGPAGMEGQMASQTAEKKNSFYCNTKALNAAERTRHNELTRKILESRKATVETEKGYELQFSPKDISLAELAEWVAAESKCCPFFDFHIDVEDEGNLLCLRLTGQEGVKAFIRSEFRLQEKQALR